MDKIPKREEWDEGELKFTHRPTGFWISRYCGQPDPAFQNRLQDEGGYDLEEVRRLGELLLREQWARQEGGFLKRADEYLDASVCLSSRVSTVGSPSTCERPYWRRKASVFLQSMF